MKRYGNIYNKVCDINNIKYAIDEVLKKICNQSKSIKFNNYRTIHTYKIYQDMVNKSYTPSTAKEFYIYEPKKRLIVSQNMYDKVVNHLVARNLLIPYLTDCLIDSNVASRVGMGTDYGRKLYFKYRNICDRKYKRYYLLKIDIKGFFRSINHDILKEKIKTRIKDEDALDLIFKIIDNYPAGCPIGFMTSQIFAIFYLNDIDHYIKEELKIKYYIRYQDDFILIHPDKEHLKLCLEDIKSKLNDLGMEVNKKTRIYKNNENMNFIGVRRNRKFSNRHRTIRKVNKNKKLYYENKLELNSIISSIAYLQRSRFE